MILGADSYCRAVRDYLVWQTITKEVRERSHRKSERSVLALKMGPFRGVKYDPIFESNLAPLKEGQYSSSTWADLDPKAEMGPSVGWNSLLIELFGLKLYSKGSRRDCIKSKPHRAFS